MLSVQDNELLCRVGPGTPMGDLMRQYWIPALLLGRAAGARLPAAAPAAAGRGPDRLPRHLRRGRPDPERLPAPRRLAVLRPQRRRRPALRLPRLEVRRRPAPASTCRRSRPRATSRTRCARGPTRASSATASSGLYMGPRETPPPLPELEANMLPTARRSSARSCATATGCRRSKATSTPATSASCTSAPCSPKTPTPGSFDYYGVDDRAPQVRRASTPSSARLRRLPPGRGRHLLLAHRPLPVPFYTMIPTGIAGRRRPGARLGAARRRAHDVLEHDGAELARRRAAAGQIGDAERHGERAVPRTRRPAAAAPAGGFEYEPETIGLARQVAPRPRTTATTTASTARLQASRRELHRHPRHLPAGPGRHGEHGHDLPAPPRAPGHDGRDDHPHAPPPDPRGEGAARRAARCRRASTTRRSTARAPAASSCRARRTGWRRRRTRAGPRWRLARRSRLGFSPKPRWQTPFDRLRMTLRQAQDDLRSDVIFRGLNAM